ncbi:MAG: 2-hydroxyacyl-CoA dehydratase family protein, partial [Phycisphaerales bacterium]|nr:2-hydroxyacyl-CoA dehydratase family protein [Phycisphaerales bacterium]
MSETALKRVPIESQKRLRGLMRDYFVDLDAAAKDTDRRVAWCTSVGPTEILTAFGFDVFFPENHGALLGAQKVSHKLIPRAVGAGYCPETCSYMNSDIGASLAGWSPLQDIYGIDGPPTPDLLAYNTNQCREVQDWFKFFSARHEATILGVRPPLYLGDVTDEHIGFVKGQLRELIEQIEKQFDLALDDAKLEEAVTKSSKASSLWREVLETARHRPAPLSFWDGLILMAPVILMRGSDIAIEFYEGLLTEMN